MNIVPLRGCFPNAECMGEIKPLSEKTRIFHTVSPGFSLSPTGSLKLIDKNVNFRPTTHGECIPIFVRLLFKV
jgi:hypothetical protein